MKEIGVRELKEKTSEVVRLVRETGEPVAITYRGKVVARLVPEEDREARKARAKEVLARMEALTRRIGTMLPGEVSAVEAVREQRRDL